MGKEFKETGLSYQEKITQKQPRTEVKGSQKPVQTVETCKGDKGSYKIK